MEDIFRKKVERFKKELPNIVIECLLEITPGLPIFDFGSFDGSTSIMLAELCPNNMLYAWEANPVSIERIKSLDLPENIEVIPFAVSNENKHVEFNMSYFVGKEDPAPCSSILQPSNQIRSHIEFRDKVSVQAKTLDSFSKERNLLNIHFIWADIQGGEVDLMLGGQNSFKNTKYFYSEVMPQKNYHNQLINRTQFVSYLPGNWETIFETSTDILLKNIDYKN